MEAQFEPPVQATPPPPTQLSPEDLRKQQVAVGMQKTWMALQKIVSGLGKVIEDVAESILRR